MLPESQHRLPDLMGTRAELLGKVPMAPEIFAEEMNSAAFTHRSDAEEVKKLQFKVFLQKVSECEEALFQCLPEGQLGQLAQVLPYFKKLRVLRLRDFKVGRAEAGEFAKAGLRRSQAVCASIACLAGLRPFEPAFARQALASNQTIRELEISGLGFGYVCEHEYGFLWEARGSQQL